jgi:hypothetical protein
VGSFTFAPLNIGAVNFAVMNSEKPADDEENICCSSPLQL